MNVNPTSSAPITGVSEAKKDEAKDLVIDNVEPAEISAQDTVTLSEEALKASDVLLVLNAGTGNPKTPER